MVVLLEDSPISTEELWSSVRVTIWFLVTSLNKALLPLLLSLAGQPALLSLGGSKHLPFKIDGGHWVGDLQCCRHFLVPFPRSVPHNPVSELYFSDTINCGTLYRQVCAFQIMSNQLNLPQVDLNQVVETSQ